MSNRFAPSVLKYFKLGRSQPGDVMATPVGNHNVDLNQVHVEVDYGSSPVEVSRDLRCIRRGRHCALSAQGH